MPKGGLHIEQQLGIMQAPKVVAMNDRRRILLSSILVMAGAGLCAAAMAITILYHTAFEARRAQLTEIAGIQAHFIEAMARFDERQDQTTHPTGSVLGDTTSVILDAYEHHPGFGETGEFVIARREGDRIVFLLPLPSGDGGDPDPVHWQTELAEPMRLALSGKSGTLVGVPLLRRPAGQRGRHELDSGRVLWRCFDWCFILSPTVPSVADDYACRAS